MVFFFGPLVWFCGAFFWFPYVSVFRWFGYVVFSVFLLICRFSVGFGYVVFLWFAYMLVFRWFGYMVFSF